MRLDLNKMIGNILLLLVAIKKVIILSQQELGISYWVTFQTLVINKKIKNTFEHSITTKMWKGKKIKNNNAKSYRKVVRHTGTNKLHIRLQLHIYLKIILFWLFIYCNKTNCKNIVGDLRRFLTELLLKKIWTILN